MDKSSFKLGILFCKREEEIKISLIVEIKRNSKCCQNKEANERTKLHLRELSLRIRQYLFSSYLKTHLPVYQKTIREYYSNKSLKSHSKHLKRILTDLASICKIFLE